MISKLNAISHYFVALISKGPFKLNIVKKYDRKYHCIISVHYCRTSNNVSMKSRTVLNMDGYYSKYSTYSTYEKFFEGKAV